MSVVRFWKVDRPYGEFSNYWPAPITVDGVRYNSSEAYYHSCKFDSAWYKEQIRLVRTPHRSKLLGAMRDQPIASQFADLNPLIARARAEGVKLRSDWDEVRVRSMEKAVRAKLDQHPRIRSKLMATKDAPIEEASPFDAFWGTGRDRQGRNELGKLLMRERTRLA